METRTSKQNQQEDNQSDRIRVPSLNDFPEEVLIHILKFLPIVDALRTSILSRQWRKLWRLLPSLDFDTTKFPIHSFISCTQIIKFIDQTLKNRFDFSLQKFRSNLDLFVCDRKEHDVCDSIEYKLDDWISYAISHKATEIDIEVHSDNPYVFSFDLLNNSHVRDVRFYGGDLGSSGLPSLNLDSIQSVCLMEISLTDETIADLICWCINLESLALENCDDMDNLRICSTTLKKLSLVDIEGSSLKICCPNLCYLHIADIWMNKYCIKSSASLEATIYLSDELECWSNVLRQLTNVKRLSTENSWFQLLCKKDASFDSVFENLNHLELKIICGPCILGIAALLRICPNINTLTLDFCFNIIELELVDKPIEFILPNLRILNLKNTKCTKIEELVVLMKKQGAALENIFLWEGSDYISWRYKFNSHTNEWHQDLE